MTCDRVAMIFSGRVRNVGPLSELLTARLLATEICLRHNVGTIPALPAGANLRKAPDGMMVDLPEGADVDAFMKAALAAGSSVISITPRHESLEDLFVREAAQDKGAA
jgi:ABC-type multidrug transport system ATPase subunit